MKQHLFGRALYLRLFQEQVKWIERCEQGTSYDGPDGPAIRQADQQELQRIKDRLKGYGALA